MKMVFIIWAKQKDNWDNYKGITNTFIIIILGQEKIKRDQAICIF